MIRHRSRFSRAGVGSLVTVALWMVGCGPPAAPRRMAVAGSRFEIGRRVGQQCAEAIGRIHAKMLSAGRILTFRRKATLYRRAAALAKYIRPEDVEEMKGLAEGSGLAYEDILYLNTFYHLTTGRLNPACRQLALWGPRTKDGVLIHARNLDWMDYPGGPLRRNNLILNVRADGALEYLALTWPPVAGVLTGANARGITVAYNRFVTPRRKQQHLGEPIFFTLGRILRTCSTLDEAVAEITHAQPLGDGSVMISDARAARAVVVEIVNGKAGVRTAKDHLIANANHPTSEAGFKGGRHSAEYPAGEVARSFPPALAPLQVAEIMRHRKVLQYSNLLSVIFVPQANVMYLSCGRYRAAAGEFKRYEIFPHARGGAGQDADGR